MATSKTVGDPAELRDANAQLRASEEFNRSLMDATADCVKVLDMDGRLLHMNTPGLCAMEIDDFGSVCGQEWESIWPAEAKADIERSVASAVGGQACSFKALCPTARGTPRWWEVTVSPIRSAAGGPVVRLLAISRDITQRKQRQDRLHASEANLRLSEKRLSKLHHIISDAQLGDAETLKRLLRLGIEEFGLENGVVAKIQDSLYSVVLADTPDGSVPEGFTCAAQDVICAETLRRNDLLAIESLAQTDWRKHRAYGEFGTEIYFGMPLSVEGRIFGTLCYTSRTPRAISFSTGDHEFFRLLAQAMGAEMTRHLTAQKLSASEERLHLALGVAHLGVRELDLETGQAFTTPEAACILGFKPQEISTRDAYWARIHPDDHEQAARIWHEALSDPGKNYLAEYRFLRSDGQWIWVASSGKVVLEGDRPIRMVAVIQDITDRKNAEAERHQLLKQVETERQRLGEVFRQAPAFICVLKGPDHVFEMINDRYHEFVGHRDLLGKPVREALPEVVEQGFIDLLDGVYQTGEAYVGTNMRVWLTQQPGGPAQQRFVDFIYEAQRNARGNITGIVALGMDVTDRQQADERVKASEERFRSLVTATTQIVWTANADGLVTEDSPTWRGFTGQTVEERLGWGWANAMHPDDKERVTALWQQAYKTMSIFEAEYRLRRHDGQYRWTLVRGVPVNGADGSLKEWVGTNVDITNAKRVEKELRESEQRFRNFADSMPHLAWIADAGSEGEIGWSNQVLLDFAGMTQDQLRGLGWKLLHHPDHVERVASKFAHHVKNSLDWEDTFPLRHRDGQYRWFLSRMTCIRDEEGYVSQIFGTNTDITRERELESGFRQVAADLSEAHLRKDEFLATLAHELRNPLAPIRNGLQLMKLAGGQPEAIDQARAMMERQLTHMVRLIDDLMDASRISQGKLELRKKPILLTAALNSAIEASDAMIGQKRHQLIVQLPAQPLMVDADLTRLAQVFQNLLNNAAKYSEPGGQIAVRAERRSQEVIVTVKDSGVGIANDQLPRIFEMFTQVNRSLEMSQGGLGIGLSLVQRLVDMHGGTVEAKSAGLGQGSEFVVTLPLMDQALEHHLPDGGEKAAASPLPLKILVVDDNRDGADSLSEMLQLMGNDTRTGYDGEQAVTLAGAYRPDVILLDIGLPKLNGYEACRLIREQSGGQGVVLIAVTGWGQDKDRIRTREAGFDHHMVKPLDPQELMKMLDGLNAAHAKDWADASTSQEK